MRRITTAFSAAALAFGMVASALPANAAVAGFDSSYAGESAFLTLSPGQSGSFTVFFFNIGTTTWTKGTATQVDLAACLEDKTTCNAQDASEAPFASGWQSATRYATHTQTTVAPNGLGTFTYNVAVPSTAANATHRFNGALVLNATGADIHNEGYYQDVTVTGGAAGGLAISPASDTNQTGTSHSITVTFTNTSGAAVANAPVDIFVVNDASPFTSSGTCSRDDSANPNFTGQTACTIDINDPITNTSGQVSFSWIGSAKETHRVVAWTAAQGTVYNSSATLTQGSATKTWIGAVTFVNVTPQTDTNPYASSHTLTAQLEESESSGTDVPLSGATVIWQVVRGGTDAGNTCSGGTVILVQSTTTDSTGKATFTYTGPADPSSSASNTTGDCVFAFYDSNGNSTFESGTDPSGAAAKTWSDATAGTGNTVTLTPSVDGNPESSNHTVTATMTDVFGNPVSGATITFQVTRYSTSSSAPALIGVVLTGTRTTDSSGVATFTYTGPADSAEDRIDACGSLNADSDCTDTNEVDFGAVSNVHKFWADAAVTGSYAGNVLFCDTANDVVYVRVSTGGTADMRFTYDSGDQYFLSTSANTVAGDGTPSTMSGFESACDSATRNTTGGDPTINDAISIDYDTDTADVSQFELEGSEPD